MNRDVKFILKFAQKYMSLVALNTIPEGKQPELKKEPVIKQNEESELDRTPEG